jgi:hypothetical protein
VAERATITWRTALPSCPWAGIEKNINADRHVNNIKEDLVSRPELARDCCLSSHCSHRKNIFIFHMDFGLPE